MPHSGWFYFSIRFCITFTMAAAKTHEMINENSERRRYAIPAYISVYTIHIINTVY
jgi:hypothetical protein